MKLFGQKRCFIGVNILSSNWCLFIEYIKNSFNKVNFFTFHRPFFEKWLLFSDCFPEGFVICNFFYVQITVVWFFLVLSNVLQNILWSLKFFWLSSVPFFKNLFLNLDPFIIALWSSLVKKGASFARTYFLLTGAYLLNILKTVSLKVLRSV